MATKAEPVGDTPPTDFEQLAARIREMLAALPDEIARQNCLRLVMEGRCRTCFEEGGEWCCYDSRGD